MKIFNRIMLAFAIALNVLVWGPRVWATESPSDQVTKSPSDWAAEIVITDLDGNVKHREITRPQIRLETLDVCMLAIDQLTYRIVSTIRHAGAEQVSILLGATDNSNIAKGPKDIMTVSCVQPDLENT